MKRNKRSTSSRAAVRGEGVVLPVDACPTCGEQIAERRGLLRLPVNGELVAVPGSPHLRCPKCGEAVLRLVRDMPGSIDFIRRHAA